MLNPSDIKVSFDFDGTLERESVQKYAKELVERGHEVWIVTSRFGSDEKYKTFFMTTTPVGLTNEDLFQIASDIGIPEERIHFTNMDDKWPFLKFHDDFLWHIDDDWIENKNILKYTKTKAISSLGANWKSKCERLIKKKLME
ncbi:MAG TPA: hypothetical protein PK122_00395 [Candidatus Paceibacterota bacterium]|nr:hypothetical protein [Candidatus Paceibacterota bacterium]